MSTDPLVERRRHHRISPKGAVILNVTGDPQQGRLGSVSVGGAFVHTPVAAPADWLGRSVELELRVDGRHAEWLRATGRIVRIAAGGVAVAFDAPPADLLTLIDEMTTASRADGRVISVVLIDADAKRRSAMVEGFRAAGCSVVEAATPLEAIVRLGESDFEPDVIAVADSQAKSDAADMRVFVTRYHPKAKLVTIGDELLVPDGIKHWLSSADPEADLPRRVRDVLIR